MRARFSYWLPALIWGGAILLASTDAFSAQNSGRLLETVLLKLGAGHLSPENFALLHFLIRKSCHVIEYSILGALLFRAIRSGRRGWTWRWALLAVLISTAVASIDESHQSLVPSRTGTPRDVLLDAAGAAAAQGAIRAAQVLFSLP